MNYIRLNKLETRTVTVIIGRGRRMLVRDVPSVITCRGLLLR